MFGMLVHLDHTCKASLKVKVIGKDGVEVGVEQQLENPVTAPCIKSRLEL